VIYDLASCQGSFEGAKEVVVPRGSDLMLGWWINGPLQRKLASMDIDLVHYTKAQAPREIRRPSVVTIYDVIPIIFPESQKWLKRMVWPRVLKQAAQRSDQVMTISQQSKIDIVKYLGVPEEKVTVTPLAVNHSRFEPGADIGSFEEIQQPYVLYLGTVEPRKNVPALVRSFRRVAKEMPHRLIIAGKLYKGGEEVLREIDKCNLSDRVEMIDFVKDEDLVAMYRGADVFVWPSIYEGWGFPPQEAMASGTPVIVSNGGALPEVVGEAGEVVEFSHEDVRQRVNDGSFEKRLADKMLSVIGDDEKKRAMSRAGLGIVKQRSWAQVAEETVGVYRKVLE
jgi:glycosyltransferase involved in cell wall biosynthesis